MAEPTDEMRALDEAVEKAGGPSALAAKIGCKSTSTPINWRTRGYVPAEWCPAIERETGVRCERLCPSVDWAVLRKQPGWDGVDRRGNEPNSNNEGN